MADRIFLIVDDKTLKPMDSAPYVKEDVLQSLLVRHPDLLAGEQVDPDNPRRWLLIRREAPIEHVGDDPHSWRLDHLFVDQDGVPTLVETKIAENPDLRRKVVGQMLDYAANITETWPVTRIKEAFESTCLQTGSSSEELLETHLAASERDGDPDDEDTIDRFWMSVETNLQAGRLRLLFVADHIPTSLVRVVEFLNDQMNLCEVLAIELRQYEYQDEEGQPPIRTLVPRVFGQRATVRKRTKGGGGPSLESLDAFLELLQEQAPEVHEPARKLVETFDQDDQFSFSLAKSSLLMETTIPGTNVSITLFFLNKRGTLVCWLEPLRRRLRAAKLPEALGDGYEASIREVWGVGADQKLRRPLNDIQLDQLLSVARDFVKQISQAHGARE